MGSGFERTRKTRDISEVTVQSIVHILQGGVSLLLRVCKHWPVPMIGGMILNGACISALWRTSHMRTMRGV